MAQRRKIARICDMFKAYTGERAWKSLGERLKRPRYLSRDDHDRKIRAMKQRTDICNYSFVNRTVKLWNQLPAEGLATLHSKQNIFRKRVLLHQSALQPFWVLARSTIVEYSQQEGFYRAPLPAQRQTPNLEDQ